MISTSGMARRKRCRGRIRGYSMDSERVPIRRSGASDCRVSPAGSERGAPLIGHDALPPRSAFVFSRCIR
jgi:hypothetical protein